MTQLSKSQTRSVAAIGSSGAEPAARGPAHADRATQVDAAADAMSVHQTDLLQEAAASSRRKTSWAKFRGTAKQGSSGFPTNDTGFPPRFRGD